MREVYSPRMELSYRGTMIMDSFSMLLFKVLIGGIPQWFFVNHGNYPAIADELRTLIDRIFPKGRSIKIVEAYTVHPTSGNINQNSLHLDHPDIQALNTLPDLSGQVREIDGRKYRLEAVD